MTQVSRTFPVANQLRALWKWCQSFRKRDWDLSDYPVVFRMQEGELNGERAHFKVHRHVASIVNWHTTAGTGNSREEALENLRDAFAVLKSKAREAGESLPRPGAKVPLRFASQQRMNARPELTEDFIHRVLDLQWAWISDESTLWDFHGQETNDAYIKRINEIYGIDASDIESANISEILERIASVQRAG